MLESPLAEAALALTWFENERTSGRIIRYRDTEREHQRAKEIRDKILSELQLDLFSMSIEEHIRLHSDVEIKLKRERWASGILPESYNRQIAFVHAKTFLYSLDRIDKLLQALKTTLGSEYDISGICNSFSVSVPDLRGVRNSVAHHDERSQGLGPKGQPIELKPVTNSLIHSPGGVLMLECLSGTKFGSTMTDGHYGEVDVSPHTLNASGAAIQDVVDLLKWKEPPSHWPR